MKDTFNLPTVKESFNLVQYILSRKFKSVRKRELLLILTKTKTKKYSMMGFFFFNFADRYFLNCFWE
jgi:hypothetical protein